MDRFDLYAALYVLCVRWHSGQWSRGYRILCRLDRAGFRPGLSLERGEFHSEDQRGIYLALARKFRHAL